MEITIKDGKFTISGELEPPKLSMSGKTYIVAGTGGFVKVQSQDTQPKEYQVALNVITKDRN